VSHRLPLIEQPGNAGRKPSKRGGAGIVQNRSEKPQQQTSDRIRINNNIRVKEVRVIDPDGNQVGILPIRDALAAANNFGLDLVEVSPMAKPPVCKIMDYGRYKYEQTKKLHEAKKKQATFQLKEIKVRPKTGEHDLQTKLGHIKKFLERKDKVKVTVMFRGREIALADKGRDLLKQIATDVQEIASSEQEPKFEGRTMMMVLSPK